MGFLFGWGFLLFFLMQIVFKLLSDMNLICFGFHKPTICIFLIDSFHL